MRKDIFTAAFLIILAILFRTILHVGPNFELVTGACLAAGYFITSKKLIFAVPIVTLLISDLIIGNGSIFLFTWSAYLITPIIGMLLRKSSKLGAIKQLLAIEGTSLLSVIIFFVWTNFGVVAVSTMYPKTLEGLALSYINALPFIKPQLSSVLVFTPLIFVVITLLRKMVWLNNLNENTTLTEKIENNPAEVYQM